MFMVMIRPLPRVASGQGLGQGAVRAPHPPCHPFFRQLTLPGALWGAAPVLAAPPRLLSGLAAP